MTKHDRAIKAAAECAGARARYLPFDDAEAVIAAYLAMMREPGPDEVRVRACVGISVYDTGKATWVFAGWDGANDMELEEAAASVDGAKLPQFRWVTANIPAWRPPVEETVEGEVVL